MTVEDEGGGATKTKRLGGGMPATGATASSLGRRLLIRSANSLILAR
jgi:hypothetical protein